MFIRINIVNISAALNYEHVRTIKKGLNTRANLEARNDSGSEAGQLCNLLPSAWKLDPPENLPKQDSGRFLKKHQEILGCSVLSKHQGNCPPVQTWKAGKKSCPKTRNPKITLPRRDSKATLPTWHCVQNLEIARRKTSSSIIELKQAFFNTGQEDGHWPGPYPGFPENGH